MERGSIPAADRSGRSRSVLNRALPRESSVAFKENHHGGGHRLLSARVKLYGTVTVLHDYSGPTKRR